MALAAAAIGFSKQSSPYLKQLLEIWVIIIIIIIIIIFIIIIISEDLYYEPAISPSCMLLQRPILVSGILRASLFIT